MCGGGLKFGVDCAVLHDDGFCVRRKSRQPPVHFANVDGRISADYACFCGSEGTGEDSCNACVCFEAGRDESCVNEAD